MTSKRRDEFCQLLAIIAARSAALAEHVDKAETVPVDYVKVRDGLTMMLLRTSELIEMVKDCANEPK